MLAHKSSHANEEGSEANSTLIEEVKKDATIVVLESKVHMATEAAEYGQDISMWDVKGWMDKLNKLKDDYATNPFMISFGGSKAPKKKANKAPKTRILGETSNSKGQDMVVAEDPVDSEESSGEDGI